MAYGTLYLQNKWFSEASPTNPHKSTATLTFSGVVADAQTVTIGTEIYEFKTSGSAGTGKIKVDVSSGVTADIAVVKLKDAITANSAIVTALASTEDDTVVVEYKVIGTEGNDIEVSTDATNATWGTDVTKLSGGSLGTPSMTRNVVVYVSPYYYWCDKEGSEYTVSWKRFTPAAY
jgi:phage tail sheath gpL-like